MKLRTALVTSTAIALASAVIGLSALSQAQTQPPANDPINPTVNNCNVTKPNTPVTPALLTSGLPCAATLIPPFTLDGLQQGFDFYSWLTFLALNSPADGKTPIGKGPGKGGDAPTIWESWKEMGDVMLPGGAKPVALGQPGRHSDESARASASANSAGHPHGGQDADRAERRPASRSRPGR